MNVCVLSVTRDRLDYTKHCFRTLKENAGCDYHHYVFDNGSEDGTWQWLMETDEHDFDVVGAPENVGISPALNHLLDLALNSGVDYDVVVKVDNDAELVTPDTLREVAAYALDNDAIVSPHILGLRQPPQVLAQEHGLSRTAVVGGIFCAAPAYIFQDGYRHPFTPTKDGEDFLLCTWARERGMPVGYLDGYEAWHYRTTDGQHEDFGWYFRRREHEREAARRLVTW